MVSSSPWKDAPHAFPPPISTRALFAFVIAFETLAFWLVIDVNISVVRQFRKRRGLYFWSLLISSWGVFFHTLAYLTAWFAPGCPWALNAWFNLFGWSTMVTGQSLVLYSRLHLVILNQRLLRGVLILIITTAITFEIPQWVSTWAASDPKLSVTTYWTPIDSIVVRITQIAFLIQESLLSGLYIWGAIRMLTPLADIKLKKVLRELIIVSAFLIIMDIVILVLAFMNEHVAKEPVQNFSYALKLKLEFFILNQLVEIVQRGRGTSYGRYVRGSGEKRSEGNVIFGMPTKDSSTKTGVSLPIMKTPPNAQRAGSGSTEGSRGLSKGSDDGSYVHQQQRAGTGSPVNLNNVAWVTREFDVTRSPMWSSDVGSKREGRRYL